MITQISHIVMSVADLNSCIDFYHRYLGIPVCDRIDKGNMESWCIMNIGPTKLVLKKDRSLIPHLMLADKIRSTVDHFAIYVDDMDKFFDRMADSPFSFRGTFHVSESGHFSIQRALATCMDPNRVALEISQFVDQRLNLTERLEAKRAMTSVLRSDASSFGGIDHIATNCSDFKVSWLFYKEVLKLKELFCSKTGNSGATISNGFSQGAFAIGGTELELFSDENCKTLGSGVIQSVGLYTEDLKKTQKILEKQSVDFYVSLNPDPPYAKCRTLNVKSPDGMHLEIVQEPC